MNTKYFYGQFTNIVSLSYMIIIIFRGECDWAQWDLDQHIATIVNTYAKVGFDILIYTYELHNIPLYFPIYLSGYRLCFFIPLSLSFQFSFHFVISII